MTYWKPALGGLLATAVATAAIVGSSGPPTVSAPATADDGILDRLAQSAGLVSQTTDAAQARTLQSLSGILDREVEERLRLEDEVETLRARLASLERQLSGPAAATASGPAEESVRLGGGSRGEVTEAAFVAAGFSETEAAYYRRRSDEAAMARLYLRDQAQREGWLKTERYRNEMAALPNMTQDLRKEMDDDTFARYLYATGRPNQVRIRRVLVGSAAESAGLESGDVLVSYDGERIFDSRSVRRSTRSGNTGNSIAVEVLRDGRRIQAYLPRGPLGVSMGSESVAPDNNRP